MMKIIDCNVFCNVTEKFSLKANKGNTRIVSVLDGTVSANGKAFSKGYSIVVANGESMDFDVDEIAKCAYIDIDNMSEDSGCCFFSECPYRLEAFVDLVCDVKKSSRENETFFKGAAQMLISLMGEKEPEATSGNKYVDMAKRYMDENFSKPVKVEDVAEHVGLDRKYLRNLFSKYLGVSTKEYLMNIRMEKAKELLISEEIPVADVAESVGYTDALAFSKIFKTHVGVSPIEFRSGEEYRPKRENVTPKKQAQKEDIKYFLL